jgi:hypothetical protein
MLEWRCAAFRRPGSGLSLLSGGYGEGETPLPIPNREVKPLSADGTWLARARESRTPPVLRSQMPWAGAGPPPTASARDLWRLAGPSDRAEAVLRRGRAHSGPAPERCARPLRLAKSGSGRAFACRPLAGCAAPPWRRGGCALRLRRGRLAEQLLAPGGGPAILEQEQVAPARQQRADPGEKLCSEHMFVE